MKKTTYELKPNYDTRASFYGKANVIEFEDGTLLLKSYNTIVAIISSNHAFIDGTYSATTLRHIKEFLKQNYFKAENKDQIISDYLVDSNVFDKVVDKYYYC